LPGAGWLKILSVRSFILWLRNTAKSYFIGDTIRDVITAERAGCKSILVLSGKEKLTNQKNWEAIPDFIFKNFKASANFLLKQK